MTKETKELIIDCAEEMEVEIRRNDIHVKDYEYRRLFYGIACDAALIYMDEGKLDKAANILKLANANYNQKPFDD